MSKLPLDAKIKLLNAVADNYVNYASAGYLCPKTQVFSITSREEGREVSRSARLAAFATFSAPIVKRAFDTRKVDQINERNPRRNLQYWQRTDEFVTEEDNDKIKTFARLNKVLENIKSDYGEQPEWFDSYAYQLYESTSRILKLRDSDLEVFRPQMNYLEQLVSARYHLTLDDIKKQGAKALQSKILSKDEALLKRGAFLNETGGFPAKPEKIVIDGQGNNTQKAIIEAIFGNTNIRKDGEKTVERTITITIKDNVIE